MTDDAISAAARAFLIESYIDLKVQLEKGTGTRPMLYLLADARNKAVIAIRKMVEIDVSEKAALMALQQEIRLYGDMMDSARQMLSRGREADREIAEEDRIELSEILTPEEAREAGIQQTED